MAVNGQNHPAILVSTVGQTHPFVVLVNDAESARCSTLQCAAMLAYQRRGEVLDESTGRRYDALQVRDINAGRAW